MKKLTWLAVCVVAAFAVAASAEQGQGGPKGGHGERFKAADADSDGKLSATEFATMCTKGDAATKFATADTDKDGFLTKDELKAAHQAMGGKHGQGKGQGGCEKGGCQKGAGEAPKA